MKWVNWDLVHAAWGFYMDFVLIVGPPVVTFIAFLVVAGIVIDWDTKRS